MALSTTATLTKCRPSADYLPCDHKGRSCASLDWESDPKARCSADASFVPQCSKIIFQSQLSVQTLSVFVQSLCAVKNPQYRQPCHYLDTEILHTAFRNTVTSKVDGWLFFTCFFGGRDCFDRSHALDQVFERCRCLFVHLAATNLVLQRK